MRSERTAATIPRLHMHQGVLYACMARGVCAEVNTVTAEAREAVSAAGLANRDKTHEAVGTAADHLRGLAQDARYTPRGAAQVIHREPRPLAWLKGSRLEGDGGKKTTRVAGCRPPPLTKLQGRAPRTERYLRIWRSIQTFKTDNAHSLGGCSWRSCRSNAGGEHRGAA